MAALSCDFALGEGKLVNLWLGESVCVCTFVIPRSERTTKTWCVLSVSYRFWPKKNSIELKQKQK